MELTLNLEETEKLVLEAINKKWPNTFDYVQFGNTYSSEFCVFKQKDKEAANGE